MKTHADQWRALSGGQQQAIAMSLSRARGAEDCENVFESILNGDLAIELKDATKTWVDQHGRLIPSELGVTAPVTDANREYYLLQPERIDYGKTLARLRQFVGEKANFVSVDDFAARSTALLGMVRGMKQLGKLAKGVWLPICLPHTPEIGDYGTTLEENFLPAVERACVAEFPDRTFKNWRKGELAGKVTIVPESRHGRLLEEMKKGPVVGLYFPACLQGFGIEADRQAIKALPESFVLSGALDIATAMVAYTGALARDWHAPGLDCAANTWESADCSLCFRASVGRLVFVYRSLDANEYCSGGVLFLG